MAIRFVDEPPLPGEEEFSGHSTATPDQLDLSRRDLTLDPTGVEALTDRYRTEGRETVSRLTGIPWVPDEPPAPRAPPAGAGAENPYLRPPEGGEWETVWTTDQYIPSQEGEEGKTWGDYVKALATNAGALVEAAGGALELGGRFMAPNWWTERILGRPMRITGKFLRERGLSAQEYWPSVMTEAAQKARERPVFSLEDDAIWHHLNDLPFVAFEQLPMMLATMLPLGMAGRAGAATSTLGKIGALTEGGISTGLLASQVFETVDNATVEMLRTSPLYNTLVRSGMSDREAREIVKTYTAAVIAPTGGLITASISGPAAKAFGKLFRTNPDIARGLGKKLFIGWAAETGQEVPQESVEQFLGNLTTKFTTNPAQDIWEGVPEAGAKAGLVSTPYSTGAVALGHATTPKSERQKPPPDMGDDLSDAERAALASQLGGEPPDTPPAPATPAAGGAPLPAAPPEGSPVPPPAGEEPALPPQRDFINELPAGEVFPTPVTDRFEQKPENISRDDLLAEAERLGVPLAAADKKSKETLAAAIRRRSQAAQTPGNLPPPPPAPRPGSPEELKQEYAERRRRPKPETYPSVKGSSRVLTEEEAAAREAEATRREDTRARKEQLAQRDLFPLREEVPGKLAEAERRAAETARREQAVAASEAPSALSEEVRPERGQGLSLQVSEEEEVVEPRRPLPPAREKKAAVATAKARRTPREQGQLPPSGEEPEVDDALNTIRQRLEAGETRPLDEKLTERLDLALPDRTEERGFVPRDLPGVKAIPSLKWKKLHEAAKGLYIAEPDSRLTDFKQQFEGANDAERLANARKRIVEQMKRYRRGLPVASESAELKWLKKVLEIPNEAVQYAHVPLRERVSKALDPEGNVSLSWKQLHDAAKAVGGLRPGESLGSFRRRMGADRAGAKKYLRGIVEETGVDRVTPGTLARVAKGLDLLTDVTATESNENLRQAIIDHIRSTRHPEAVRMEQGEAPRAPLPEPTPAERKEAQRRSAEFKASETKGQVAARAARRKLIAKGKAEATKKLVEASEREDLTAGEARDAVHDFVKLYLRLMSGKLESKAKAKARGATPMEVPIIGYKAFRAFLQSAPKATRTAFMKHLRAAGVRVPGNIGPAKLYERLVETFELQSLKVFDAPKTQPDVPAEQREVPLEEEKGAIFSWADQLIGIPTVVGETYGLTFFGDAIVKAKQAIGAYATKEQLAELEYLRERMERGRLSAAERQELDALYKELAELDRKAPGVRKGRGRYGRENKRRREIEQRIAQLQKKRFWSKDRENFLKLMAAIEEQIQESGVTPQEYEIYQSLIAQLTAMAKEGAGLAVPMPVYAFQPTQTFINEEMLTPAERKELRKQAAAKVKTLTPEEVAAAQAAADARNGLVTVVSDVGTTRQVRRVSVEDYFYAEAALKALRAKLDDQKALRRVEELGKRGDKALHKDLRSAIRAARPQLKLMGLNPVNLSKAELVRVARAAYMRARGHEVSRLEGKPAGKKPGTLDGLQRTWADTLAIQAQDIYDRAIAALGVIGPTHRYLKTVEALAKNLAKASRGGKVVGFGNLLDVENQLTKAENELLQSIREKVEITEAQREIRDPGRATSVPETVEYLDSDAEPRSTSQLKSMLDTMRTHLQRVTSYIKEEKLQSLRFTRPKTNVSMDDEAVAMSVAFLRATSDEDFRLALGSQSAENRWVAQLSTPENYYPYSAPAGNQTVADFNQLLYAESLLPHIEELLSEDKGRQPTERDRRAAEALLNAIEDASLISLAKVTRRTKRGVTVEVRPGISELKKGQRRSDLNKEARRRAAEALTAYWRKRLGLDKESKLTAKEAAKQGYYKRTKTGKIAMRTEVDRRTGEKKKVPAGQTGVTWAQVLRDIAKQVRRREEAAVKARTAQMEQTGEDLPLIYRSRIARRARTDDAIRAMLQEAELTEQDIETARDPEDVAREAEEERELRIHHVSERVGAREAATDVGELVRLERPGYDPELDPYHDQRPERGFDVDTFLDEWNLTLSEAVPRIIYRAYHELGLHIASRFDEGFDTLGTLLIRVGGRITNPLARDMASRIASSAMHTEIKLGRLPGDIVAQLRGGTIVIDNQKLARFGDDAAAVLGHALLHEAAHAGTVVELMHNPVIRAQMQALMDKMQGVSNAYGLKDVYEFVAEAFTNPAFQRELASRDIHGRHISLAGRVARSNTLLRRFVNMVRKALGFDPLYDSILESFIKQREAVLKPESEPDYLVREAFPERFALEVARPDAEGLVEPYERATVKGLRGAVGRGLSKAQAGGRLTKLGFMALDQIVEVYEKLFTDKDGRSLLGNDYFNATQKKWGLINTTQLEDEKVTRKWRKLPGPVMQRLHQVMMNATLYQLHPDAKLTDDVNSHVKLDAHKRIHERVSRLYEAMPQEAKEVYQDAKKHLEQLWIKERDAITTNIFDAYDVAGMTPDQFWTEVSQPGMTVARVVEQLQTQDDSGQLVPLSDKKKAALRTALSLRRQELGPYFPLRRTGEYVVVANQKAQTFTITGVTERDAKKNVSEFMAEYRATNPGFNAKQDVSADGLTVTLTVTPREVYMLDTEYEARNLRRSLLAEDNIESVDEVAKRQEFWSSQTSNMSWSFLNDLEQRIKDPGARMAVREFYLQRLPDTSFHKAMMRRQRVIGADMDMLRSYSTYAKAGAYTFGQLKFGREIAAAMGKMRELVKQAQEDDDPRALRMSEVLEELVRRDAGEARRVEGSKFTDRGLALGFLGILVSPAYVLINMTQPSIYTIPYMKQQGFSMAAITSAMASAYATVGPQFLSGSAKSGLGFRAMKNSFHVDEAFSVDSVIAKLKGSGDQISANLLNDLIASGLLDQTFSQSLRTISESGSKKGTMEALMDMGRTMPHLVEVMNRTVTALMAVELGTKNNMTYEQILDLAMRSIRRTQFDYSSFNKPRYFSRETHALLPLITQFKMHGQQVSYLVAKNTYDMVKGQDRETKRAAAKYLIWMGATHAAVAGNMGILWQPAKWIIQAGLMLLQGFDDDPIDEPLEKHIGDFWTYVGRALSIGDGTKFGEVMTYGLPRLLGSETSLRLGLQGAIFMEPTSKPADRGFYADVILSILGPMVMTGGNIHRGLTQIVQGDVLRGTGNLMPKMARDFMTTYREHLSGEGIKDAYGQTLVPPEELGVGAAITQAAGFQPAKKANVYRDRNFAKDAKAKIKQQRQRLLREGSLQEIGEYNREIAEYFRSQKVPRWAWDGMLIYPSTLQRSRKERRRRELEQEGGLTREERRAFL